MAGVGKENVAKALAGSISQLTQKAELAQQKSFCASLDDSHPKAAESYEQLRKIYQDAKKNFLAASAKLYFLNKLSADSPLQEVSKEEESQAKLTTTNSEINAIAGQHRVYTSEQQRKRENVRAAKELLTKRLAALKLKLEEVQKMPSSLDTLNKLKSSANFDQNYEKINALKKQKAQLEQKLRNGKAKQDGFDKELESLKQQQQRNHKVDQLHNYVPSTDHTVLNKKSYEYYSLLESIFGTSTSEIETRTSGDLRSHNVVLHINQTKSAVTVIFSHDGQFKDLILQPQLVKTSDIIRNAKLRSSRSGAEKESIVAWILTEVRARLHDYVPGMEPERLTTAPEDAAPSATKVAPTAEFQKSASKKARKTPLTHKNQAIKTKTPSTKRKTPSRKTKTPASKRSVSTSIHKAACEKVSTSTPQTGTSVLIKSTAKKANQQSLQKSTKKRTPEVMAVINNNDQNSPAVGTLEGAMRLTARFATPNASQNKSATAASIGMDSTVVHESEIEEEEDIRAQHDLDLSARLASLNDSAAAFQPTRTLARD